MDSSKTSQKSADNPHKKSKKQRTDAGTSSAAAPAAPPAEATLPVAVAPAPEPTLAPTRLIPTEESLPHLTCTVCLSFPEKDILQCNSGHILCRPCYDRVCHEERPQCPTCRTQLDTTKEVRNTLAEQVIAALPVACPNEPCTAELTRGTLERHLKSECGFRPVCCKYSLLGCKWKGVFLGLAAHEDHCKRADMPGWKLLDKVKAQNDAAAAESRGALAEASKAQRVVDMLSGRCRDVEMTHVVLHKCGGHEHVAGKPAHLVSAAFHSLGFRWKVFTVHEQSGGSGGQSKYSAVVQLRDDVRVQLAVDAFVLHAPAHADAGLAPAVFSHAFSGSSRQRTTEPATLAEGSAADALEQLEKLELRVGLVDRRAGRLGSTFQGHVPRGYGMDGGESEQDAWGSEYGDEDEGDGMDGSDGEYSESGHGFEGRGWPPHY